MEALIAQHAYPLALLLLWNSRSLRKLMKKEVLATYVVSFQLRSYVYVYMFLTFSTGYVS